jgi:hypothetical protein
MIARSIRPGMIVRKLIIAALALTVALPLAGTAALAKKGPLTSVEKLKFKLSKALYTREKRQAKQTVKLLEKPYRAAEKEFLRADAAAVNSRKNLDVLKTRLDDFTRIERTGHDLTGNGPFTPSPELRAMQKGYDKAEAYHVYGPRGQFLAAQAARDALKPAYDAANVNLNTARENLRTRRADKTAARAANLQAAADRKAARAAARQRAPIIYDQLPADPNQGNALAAPPANAAALPGQINYSQLPNAANPQGGQGNIQMLGFNLPQSPN